jgi:hypothetical protein
MSTKIIAALALAAFATCSTSVAHAEAKTWYFNYQGFQHSSFDGPEWEEPSPAVWEPNATFSGQFVAEDRNHDAVISRDEVSSFRLQGMDYTGCPPSPYYNCSLSYFNFSRAGLSFGVGSGGSDPEGYVWGYDSFVSNRGWNSESHHMFMVTRDTYTMTADTKFNISAPVPEPETYAMFGLGLLGLAGLRRLRK